MSVCCDENVAFCIYSQDTINPLAPLPPVESFSLVPSLRSKNSRSSYCVVFSAECLPSSCCTANARYFHLTLVICLQLHLGLPHMPRLAYSFQVEHQSYMTPTDRLASEQSLQLYYCCVTQVLLSKLVFHVLSSAYWLCRPHSVT
jgi:hypothetical protein